MKLVVCIDKSGGMMYNKRRQSRDRVMMDNLTAHLKGRKIVISPYSEELFVGRDMDFRVCTVPRSADDEFVFIEEAPLPEASEVDEVVIYNWCTDYPRDRIFDFDLSDFKRISKEKFAGYSHGKITKEVFKK